MLKLRRSYTVFSGITKFRFRRVLYIALFWTAIDLVSIGLNFNVYDNQARSFLVRSMLVFCMSSVMGYFFVFSLKNIYPSRGLFINFLAKSVVLIFAAIAMNFIVNFTDNFFVLGASARQSVIAFYNNTLNGNWLLRHTLYWLVLFAFTQLYVDINDKYAPGVFIDIISGKYLQPKNENRIIMFLDLKDSTPIAEKLGHENYFLFIREFIYYISLALIEHGGIIYQYVGDEIVVSWKYSKKNVKESLAAVIAARKNIQRNSIAFRDKYNIIPEFRMGLHVGDVTIGEIGVIKKDLAMSGDTMNTAARIRSACNELNQKFIVSGEFAEKTNLKAFQLESLGIVELKGKAHGIELFALKI